MKKIALFVTAIAVSLSIGGKVFADTTAATFADKAGTTAESTILYPIDKAVDDLKVSMASGDTNKAEALVDVAEERLGESEVLADKQNTDLSNQALTEYNDKMTEAQDKIENAIDKSSSTTTDSAVKLDELEKSETELANRQLKSIEVLKNIEKKSSGNAKETLALVIEMQTKKKEAIVAVAKERQALLQDKKAVKEAEKKLEEAKKAGDDQAIKAAEDALKQAQTTLATQNEKFTQAVAGKKEAMKGGVGQAKKEAKKDAKKDSKTQTSDATTSTNSTTSEDKTAITETAPAQTNDTTPAPTNTTESTVTQDASVTNNTKTDIKVKENKGEEVKANKETTVKENKGQEMKADKENKSANENKSKH